MAQAFARHRLQNIPYQAGVRNTIPIDRDGVLAMLAVRLAFTVTNGATGPVGPLWMTLARLIRRLEVVVNGQDTVVAINGAHLASRALFDFGARQFGMDDTVVLTNSAATNYQIVLPIPFYLPRARRPDDTALDLRKVAQATIGITWGDQTDLFTTPNNAAISNVTCAVEGHYLLDAPADQVYMVRTLDMVEQNNAASNQNFQILVDRGQDIFWRSFHIATLRNDIAVNTMLDGGDIRLLAGSFFYVNREAVHVRAEARRAFGLPAAEAADATGIYPVYMPFLGQGTTLINAGALTADLFFNFNITYTSGTEKVSISREAMRPLRA